jgi:hypothetical protein
MSAIALRDIVLFLPCCLLYSEVSSKTFPMSEKDPALRVTNAVADYYSLQRNLRLDFINGKPKKAVEHLVSVIKSATIKDRSRAS